ncbi:17922_t:CDS:2, partial [Funneliformis geosporum]
ENLSNKNDISTAINIASKQVGSLSLLLNDDNIHELDISDLTEQYTLLDKQINFIKMIEIRIKHEAYSLRILECKYHDEQIAKNSDLTINPNKASHMIAHLINNKNPEIRFITQCKKCWKTNRKTMVAKLAQHHKEKLARNKEPKNKKK